jgi:Zn-finger nucleic acid-binding protein
MYNRMGRVFAAAFRKPAIVRTLHGTVEALPGDYLVVEPESRRVSHWPAEYFAQGFGLIDRPVPRRALATLSEVVVSSVGRPGEGPIGTTCVRCGRQRTRSEFEGVPTCVECELKLKAEREETIRCRHDDSPMRKEVIQNVIVDRCPECRGVWFDGGELEVLGTALRRAADYGMPSELANEILQSIVQPVPE